MTEEEIAQLRALVPKIRHVIDEDEIAGRVWATIRRGFYYIAAILSGIVLFRENLKAIWLWLIK